MMSGKNLFHAAAVFCLCAFSANAFCEDETDPVSAERSRIASVIKPYAPNTVTIEKLEDKNFVTGPAFTWRLVFSRLYKPQMQRTIIDARSSLGPEVIASEKSFTDHADIVLVDREAGVKIDEMLKRKEIENDGNEGIFFRKYGILWRNLTSNEYANFVVYLGHDEKYHFFCSANLSVIATLKKALDLEGGENLLPVFASALNARDVNDFTPVIAMRELKSIGPECVPYVVTSVEDCLALDYTPVTQMMTLYSLNAPEADEVLCKFASAKDKRLLQALFDTVILNKPYRKSLIPVYVSILEHHAYVPEAGLALKELGETKLLKEAMEKIAAKPRTVYEFISAKRMLFVLANPGTETAHKYYSEQIKLLAIRNGEVPDSIKYRNVNESEAEREVRLAKKDRERLEPLEKELAALPYKEFTLLYALELCVFNTKAERVDAEYVKRVRRSGKNVLAALPYDMVEPALRTLIRHSEIPSEKADLEALYSEMKKRSR